MPFVLAVGVPLSVPVPLPLSTNVTPLGRVQGSITSVALTLQPRVIGAVPVAVTEKVPAMPTPKVLLLALVMAGAVSTFSVVLPLLPLKLLSVSVKVARIVSEPSASEVVAHVAVSGEPALSATALQPVIVVPLDLKFTVPAGVPVPGATALTVAVKVTDAPEAEGFAPLVSATVVVVLALATVRLAVPLLFA